MDIPADGQASFPRPAPPAERVHGPRRTRRRPRRSSRHRLPAATGCSSRRDAKYRSTTKATRENRSDRCRTRRRERVQRDGRRPCPRFGAPRGKLPAPVSLGPRLLASGCPAPLRRVARRHHARALRAAGFHRAAAGCAGAQTARPSHPLPRGVHAQPRAPRAADQGRAGQGRRSPDSGPDTAQLPARAAHGDDLGTAARARTRRRHRNLLGVRRGDAHHRL